MTRRDESLPAAAQSALTDSAQRTLWQRYRTPLKGLVVPTLIIVVLEIVVRIGWLPSYQMPAPSEIVLTLRDLADGALWKHISASLLRVLSGFLIGASLALVFAAWVGLSREA
ncbi:ABC transporter permease, partial [Pseudomonas syringae pv. actinidiae]|nr:ABC transporter permease [Pseudomonas syringae pv. actinidiae]